MNSEIPQNKEDVSSLSNFHQIKQKHFDVDLTICFETKTLSGHAIIDFEILDSSATSLVLDSKGLAISRITQLSNNRANSKELKYQIHSQHRLANSLGTPLEIFYEKSDSSSLTVQIFYATTEKSDGLQWLDKQQTSTKNKPFLFSQCEAILARTVIPCQDSPAVKVYFNNVYLTAESGVTALFGGKAISTTEVLLNDVKHRRTHFTQKIIIPTYLFSVAAGELEFRQISERCGVYAEIPLIQAAVEEFTDTENFIKTAEAYIDYPYVWGDYNLLVLPPAFPYGGMENPNLTYINPALIVGDKSLVGVVAHEIAHSWTGNLVTNKDWNNFWMNEGFTVFLERKILAGVEGKEFATLQADVGHFDFKQAVGSFGESHCYTCLHPKINEEDPDDAFSKVPYEKGFNFLAYVETLTGEELFRTVIRKYIKKFEYQSITFEDFKLVLEEELKNANKQDLLSKIDYNAWVHTPGYLPVEPDFNTSLAKQANELFNEIVEVKENETLSSDVLASRKERYVKMIAHVKMVLLNLCLNNITKFNKTNYAHLADITGLNGGNNNPEIGAVWLEFALKLNDKNAIKFGLQFLAYNGRMKYIRPVYRALFSCDSEVALKFFEENRKFHHPVASRLVENDMKKLQAAKEN